MKTALTAFAAVAVATPVLVFATPATAASDSPTFRATTPNGIQDCRVRTKWKTHRLVGACGNKKINVKANGYAYSRIKGRVYGKKFDVRYSGSAASDTRSLSGTVGGKKLRYWGNGSVNTVFREVDGIQTFVRVVLGFKGNKAVECSAQGTVTGPSSVSWSSSSFTRVNLSGTPTQLSGTNKMWGACATVIASQVAFLGT